MSTGQILHYRNPVAMVKFNVRTSMSRRAPDWEEKIKSAIAFFAWEYERLVQRPLAVTSLHRYLASLDCAGLGKASAPAPGPGLSGMERRPACRRNGCEGAKEDRFLLMPEKGEYVVKATGQPDVSCFSSFELEQMKRLVRINADYRTKGFRELDQGREETWVEIKNAVMGMSDVGPFTKHTEVGRMSGLELLIEKYTNRLKDLENEMAEVKRKLETVKEASRLLEEEGLSEDKPKAYSPY